MKSNLCELNVHHEHMIHVLLWSIFKQMWINPSAKRLQISCLDKVDIRRFWSHNFVCNNAAKLASIVKLDSLTIAKLPQVVLLYRTSKSLLSYTETDLFPNRF